MNQEAWKKLLSNAHKAGLELASNHPSPLQKKKKKTQKAIWKVATALVYSTQRLLKATHRGKIHNHI